MFIVLEYPLVWKQFSQLFLGCLFLLGLVTLLSQTLPGFTLSQLKKFPPSESETH